jgi:diguanylate cyclase (GGDEF)-like protein
MQTLDLILTVLTGILALAGGVVASSLPEEFNGLGLFSLIFLQAVYAVFVSRASGESAYRLGRLSHAMGLVALTVVGGRLLGGWQVGHNIAGLIACLALLSTLAHPMHTVYALILILLSTAFGLAQDQLGLIPGLETQVQTDPLPTLLLDAATPLGLAAIFAIVTMAYRRQRMTQSSPVSGPSQTDSDTTSGSQVLRQSAIAMAPVPDEPGTDPTASQVFNRSYLENLGAQALKEKQGTLDSVVYFMSRNFKAYSAVGFLVDPTGQRLVVNSVTTRSRHFNYDCVPEIGRGIVGGAVEKAAGFITGNLKSYSGALEYYSQPENINSIMVMRVMDVQAKRLQGLLVVDSENIRAFTDEHKELMYRFTQIASVMITHANMSIQMNRQALMTDMQYDIAKRLSESLKPDDVIEVLTYALRRAFEYDRIVLCGYNPSTQRGYLWKVIDANGIQMGNQEFDINHPQSLYGSVFRNRRPLLIQKFGEDDKTVRFEVAEPEGSRPKEIIVAPLLDDRQFLWAVIGIESDRPGRYDQPEFQLLRTIMHNVQMALSKARMYKEMENQATIDGLTQIPNHRTFQEVLSKELERAGRYGSPLSLLLMDIDHFKSFNDKYGHPVGDLVLKMVAKSIQNSIRGTDFCARYGGEEFVVVLIQTDEQQAAMLAERVRSAVEEMQVQNEDTVLRVTVSIGSATFTTDAQTKQQLIDSADKAMYHSKQTGRNRVSMFSRMGQRSPQSAGQPAHS